MEKAGKFVADVALSFLMKKAGRKKAVIFAGKGNNAGDSFVAARYLIKRNIETRIILLFEPDSFKDDTALNFRRVAEKYPEILLHADSLDKLLSCEKEVEESDLIIDGIFGTGFSGAPRGHTAEGIFFY